MTAAGLEGWNLALLNRFVRGNWGDAQSRVNYSPQLRQDPSMYSIKSPKHHVVFYSGLGTSTIPSSV